MMLSNVLHRRPRGVTLLELVIVLVVLGILVAVAIPTYRSYAIRMNRGDARRDLVALAAQLQRCFARSRDYRVEAQGSPVACITLPSTNAEGSYTVNWDAGEPTASSFRLVATPQGRQAADSRCGSLTIDQAGQRGVSGSLSPQECWQGPSVTVLAALVWGW
jgi:type IV pilus assembly protein PilE